MSERQKNLNLQFTNNKKSSKGHLVSSQDFLNEKTLGLDSISRPNKNCMARNTGLKVKPENSALKTLSFKSVPGQLLKQNSKLHFQKKAAHFQDKLKPNTEYLQNTTVAEIGCKKIVLSWKVTLSLLELENYFYKSLSHIRIQTGQTMLQ